jgi:hypothetical protein
MVNMRTILIQNQNCTVRPIGNGLVIVSPEDGETHSLDRIGAFIWERIDGKNDLESILGVILREYEVDADIATKDLQSFIFQLLEAGLIRPAGQAISSQ